MLRRILPRFPHAPLGRCDPVVPPGRVRPLWRGLLSRLDNMTPDRIRRLVDVNLIGAMLVAKEAVLRMSQNYGGDGGSIVNISSIASFRAVPNHTIYCTAKAALDMLTMTLALELGPHQVSRLQGYYRPLWRKTTKDFPNIFNCKSRNSGKKIGQQIANIRFPHIFTKQATHLHLKKGMKFSKGSCFC